MTRKRFDQVSEVNPASIRKERKPQTAHVSREKDRDYTIPGILALVGIVLVTALYLNDAGTIAYQASDSPNVAGGAYVSSIASEDAPDSCQAQSYCDGSKLVRQNSDCTRFVAYCQNGCKVNDEGYALCR